MNAFKVGDAVRTHYKKVGTIVDVRESETLTFTKDGRALDVTKPVFKVVHRDGFENWYLAENLQAAKKGKR